jgi:hypothetical protein
MRYIDNQNLQTMSVYISKLKPSPQTIGVGLSTITLSYYGIVDAEEDNSVRLDLMIEPETPLYFIESRRKKKKLRTDVQFTSNFLEYFWGVQIQVDEVSDRPKVASIRLEATDSKGFRSKSDSFIIYY